ncbi:TetR/AcrR family transcriptional regulator [Cupriavidus basilensis]|uniref:TetR/AcrR family transcriptional regulator n=1 Tax=Cupriavidus basilensis TaxID=68895 RepID=UPI0020A68DD6|nr:TetR/AcrR family transcriptional regulator [Cupriavidus basilensis]MCP3022441.1 TetR/AcrR family transcriptional regulator [Cupriavidus basilensis]MDR3382393.1 helix-turn-helix domain containing protein [Cupriavidus basilensis]
MSIFGRLSFKDQAFKLREDAILDAATRILAGKGFDLMTMDDVALEVGISKPSLYKHFKSKEDLVGEALIRLIDGALEYLEQLPGDLTGLARLRALLEWALRVRLTGGLPFLPSTSPHVREMLTRNLRYVTRVLKLNRQLEKLVAEAKAAGELDPSLPDDVILFSYYARTCDPAVEYLQLYSKLGTDAIVEHMLKVSFEGMRSHL